MSEFKKNERHENDGRKKILYMIQEQLGRSLDTTTFLDKAIYHMMRGNKRRSMDFIENLFQEERYIDELRRKIFRESTECSEDYREDLLHLVKRLDLMADHIKDSARNISLLLKKEVPEDVLVVVKKISRSLVNMAKILMEGIDLLIKRDSKALDKVKEVDPIEQKIDDLNMKVKELILDDEGLNLKPSIIITINNLVDAMENASDMCADTADYILIIISKEKK
ncbi:MAG: DUF47 domain-containing protein [Candidatus Asgardarchaeia archaeon]